MKLFTHIVTIVILLATSSSEILAKSTNDESKTDKSTYYLELTGSVNPSTGAVVVTLNIGRLFATHLGVTPSELAKISKTRNYSSMVEAANMLAPFGWEVVSTYCATVRGQSKIYWVLGKEVETPEDILEGLIEK